MGNWERRASRTAVVTGAALALLAAGWMARDAINPANGNLGSAVHDWGSWLGDAGKVALGALIGAVGAWIVARMNRSEARAARFADRIRELTAQLTEMADKQRVGITGQMILRQGEPVAPLPAVKWEFQKYDQYVRELQLIVQSPRSYEATTKFHQAMVLLQDFAYDKGQVPGAPDHAEVAAWRQTLDRFTKARDTLEDAIRVELGVQPVDRRAVAALWSDLGGEDVDAPGLRLP